MPKLVKIDGHWIWPANIAYLSPQGHYLRGTPSTQITFIGPVLPELREHEISVSGTEDEVAAEINAQL